jgi:flavodoxin
MKACVIYFSRTGNTKSMAEAISDSIKAEVFDIASCEPAIIEKFDMLILGTPVEGFRPTKEISAVIERIPKAEGKKAIVFCTYARWKARTLKTMTNQLAKRGYDTILSVSKKGVKPNQTDFSDIVDQIKEAIEKL